VFSTGNGAPGASSDPGDIRSGVDFSYKIPGLRNWLTFYGDAFDEDEYSPIGYPRKSAYQGGIYMPRIPGFHRLDLRLEGGSTVPPDFGTCNGCFYTNTRFLSGYTSQGNLMGSWIGRAAQGEQAFATYWVSSRDTIRFNYRHRKVAGQFISQGGTSNDAAVSANIWLGDSVMLSGLLQYEKWNFPVLDPMPRSNITTSIEVSFWPRNWSLSAH
jgi:Capsule assembly protein Wzi